MAINLLPQIQKKEIQDEKVRRKIIFIFSLILLNFFLFMIMVFILNAYLSSRLNFLANSISEKNLLMKSQEFQESKGTIDEANQNLLKIFSIKQEQVSIAAVLERLGQLIPNGIYLESFSFQNSFVEEDVKGNKEKVFFGKARLEGLAKSREVLFSFKKALSQESPFKDLYFDPSSWVMPVNAKFSAEFSYFPGN